MPAIITSKFRLENASNFKETVTGDSIYLAIGKSDNWNSALGGAEVTAPTPVDTLVERNDFWQNAIALKKVDSASATHIVPRYNWTLGNTYIPWSDASDSIFSQQFYVITSEFKVYKLVNKLYTATTAQIEPTHTTTAPTVRDPGDGHFWKYMYTVTAAEATAFMTNLYMPVKTVVIPTGGVIGDLSPEDQTRYTYQNNSAADAGKIFRIVVTSGGTGYLSAPTVTIEGNGTGATATAYVSGNVVTHIDLTVDGNGIPLGSGYSVANVKLTPTNGGSGAVAHAVLSPKGGHGTDPVSELGGFYVGLRVVLNGPEGGGDFIVSGAQFRQIGVIRNPYNYGTTTVSTSTTLSSLKTLTLTVGSTGGFKVGDYFTGGTSQAKAFVDAFDSTNGIIKYHQNDKTGYTAFSVSETITGATAGTGSVASLGNPEVDRFSGEVMFVENRAAINRSASQLEDIKIILEF
jgi:hypothetical protein